MAEAGDVRLSDLPVDVGNGFGNHLLAVRRVQLMGVDLVEGLEVVAEMGGNLDGWHPIEE